MATINAINSGIPIEVTKGGTGATTNTANGVLLGNGTSAITATVAGTTGQILTGVTGSSPIFASPAASSITITGDTGGALAGAAFTFAGGTTGLAFGGSGSTETLTFAGITANGGTVSLATDATTSTINIGTGAGAKTSTFGSTNTTSSTIIKSGSGNVVVNSGLTVDSSGRMTNAVQPCFLTYLATSLTNVTGNATNYKIVFDTVNFDQSSSVASGVFTAPKAGKYFFYGAITLTGIIATHTTGYMLIVKNNFVEYSSNPYVNAFTSSAASPSGFLGLNASQVFSLAVNDTVSLYANVTGGTKVVGLSGNSGTLANGYPTQFGGYLIC